MSEDPCDILIALIDMIVTETLKITDIKKRKKVIKHYQDNLIHLLNSFK